MTLREATIKDVAFLAPLFDSYRMFYRKASDMAGARTFLKDRINNRESVIYIAFLSNGHTDGKTKPVGFTQLYPIFFSVSMESMYILNDLFIDPAYRGKGIGTALIDMVKKRCVTEKQKGIVIQTEKTNLAQKLYEHLGFTKDPDLHYFWSTKKI